MAKFQNPITPPDYAFGWCNGDVARGSGDEMPIFYPATGQQVGTLIEDGPRDVDRAVSAAAKAFKTSGWPELSVEKRATILES